MPEARPPIAFLAAALVLLVLPLMVALGLAAIAIAERAGAVADMARVLGVEAGTAFLLLLLAWVALALGAVAAMLSRLIHTMRS